MNVRNLVWALVGLLIVAAGNGSATVEAQEQSERRSLEVEDFARIQSVGAPRISPDGDWVAYTVSTSFLEEDRRESRIWMVPTAGGEPIPMTAKGNQAGSPQWSPDGRYLSFAAARNGGKSQVWVLDMRGGEAQQLTDIDRGVGYYRWSPDSTKLLLVLEDEKDSDAEGSGGEESGGQESEGEKKKPDLPDPWVIDRLQFKRDYVGYLTGDLHNHVYVYDLGSKELRQITSGDYDDSSAVWSPDGKRVAFVSNRTEDPDANYNTDIWAVEADNADQGKNPVQLTSNPGADRSPVWSPDGEWIAYVSRTDVQAMVYATPHLAVVPASGGTPNVLTKRLDRHVGGPRFSADSGTIYFTFDDSGERPLGAIPVGGGDVERIISGPRDVFSYELAKDGTIVAGISEPHFSAELFVRDAGAQDNGDLRRLTHVNDAFFSGVRLGEVREVRFNSKDGTEIEGFIYLPPSYEPGRRYPTILRIHGGPVGQYSHGFSFEAQLFAANGYVAVLTNPRGSSGYGQDFTLAIWQGWGEKDYEDVVAGVDYAIEQGYADPEQLGVGGWSYGGILTNNVIVKTNRFKGAISGAGASLYIAMYGHDQYQRWYELELGLPWENREVWERISPLNYVENAVTPTLFIGGEKDWNVPIINSELMYQSMKRLGRETQLVVYPNQYHGINRLPYRKDLYERYLAWYDKYVKGTPTASGKD